MRTLLLLLSSVMGVALGRTGCNTEGVTLNRIITNPDPNWNFDCLEADLMNEFLASRHHIEEVVNCLQDYTLCSQPGYETIAGEILDRIGSAGNCFNCSPRLSNMVQSAVRRLQKEHPDLLRRGLAYLA